MRILKPCMSNMWMRELSTDSLDGDDYVDPNEGQRVTIHSSLKKLRHQVAWSRESQRTSGFYLVLETYPCLSFTSLSRASEFERSPPQP
jgi:hypothetical protein